MTYDPLTQSLAQFREAFGQAVDPTMKDVDTLLLGAKLIREEAKEFQDEVDEVHGFLLKNEEVPWQTKANLLKELGDVLYVTYWFAAAFKLDLGEAFRRIHNSNMSKLGEDGKPIRREDGKVLKGPNYDPPYLRDLVDRGV